MTLPRSPAAFAIVGTEVFPGPFGAIYLDCSRPPVAGPDPDESHWQILTSGGPVAPDFAFPELGRIKVGWIAEPPGIIGVRYLGGGLPWTDAAAYELEPGEWAVPFP